MEQINLTVIATNTVAKRQYEKLGFHSFALEKNAIKDNGVYYDEEQMVLFLTQTAITVTTSATSSKRSHYRAIIRMSLSL